MAGETGAKVGAKVEAGKGECIRDEKMLENERMAQQRWEQQQQPYRRSKILQDEHGCYQDMEANGHMTGDDIGD